MEPLTNIFIGRSGCGKGTQVEKLTHFLQDKNLKSDIFHLEAGGRFREFIKEDTYSSELAKEISEEGGLQPEFLSIWAWGGKLVSGFKKGQHLFVDGTPRRLVEAKILESVFDFYDRTKVNIIYLNVSREWSKERMHERGRADDIEECDIEKRLDWFESDVVPVVDYYRGHKNHNFIDVNGEQSIEKVHQDIVDALNL